MFKYRFNVYNVFYWNPWQDHIPYLLFCFHIQLFSRSISGFSLLFDIKYIQFLFTYFHQTCLALYHSQHWFFFIKCALFLLSTLFFYRNSLLLKIFCVICPWKGRLIDFCFQLSKLSWLTKMFVYTFKLSLC